ILVPVIRKKEPKGNRDQDWDWYFVRSSLPATAATLVLPVNWAKAVLFALVCPKMPDLQLFCVDHILAVPHCLGWCLKKPKNGRAAARHGRIQGPVVI